jgi:hypothetical protein
MPVGLGQGLVRLLQFSGVLSSENATVCHFTFFISFLNHDSPLETPIIALGKCRERLLHSQGYNEIYAMER